MWPLLLIFQGRESMDHLFELGFGKTWCLGGLCPGCRCDLLAPVLFGGLGLPLWKPGSALAFSIRQVTQQRCLFDFLIIILIISLPLLPPIMIFLFLDEIHRSRVPAAPSNMPAIASRNQDKYCSTPFGRRRQSLSALPGRQSSRLSSPRKQLNTAARKCTSDSFGRRLMFPSIILDA